MPGILDEWFSRRVLVVTGKGGVGKSTIAAALASISAGRGMRTLLLDVENKGDSARFLDAGPPRYAPKQAMDNLSFLGLEPQEVLDEYLKVAIKVPRFYRIGPVTKVFDFIATAAPGVREVLIAGKIGFEERARDNGRPRWDLIVVDAAPAGQVVSHLRGPKSLQELVQVGMIRNQTDWVRNIIENPAKTGVVVVALPEEMPTSETAELLEQMPKEINTPVVGLVANRVVPPLEHRDALAAFASHADALAERAGGTVEPGIAAADLFAGLAENQAPFRQQLRELGPPVLEVPFLPLGRHDLEHTHRVAEALQSEEPVS